MRLDTLLEFARLSDRAGGWEACRGLEITGLAHDSRRVEPGNLFVAVRGYVTDGHEHVGAAAAAGAAAALVEEPTGADLPQITIGDTRRAMGPLAAAFWGFPGERLFTVGVTGTNGKTTTMRLIRTLLEARLGPVGSLGTISYRVGGTATDAPHTTPEAIDLHAMLARMIEENDAAAVMEVSSHALALGRVDGLEFDLACFTNLGRDHLDFHPTMEEYLAAKTRLFTHHRKAEGTAIINVDDPAGARLAATIEPPVVTVGISPKADLVASDIQVGWHGLEFTLTWQGERSAVHSPLLGAFNIQNLLVAAGAGLKAEIPLPDVAAGLAILTGVPGRMERLPAPDGIEIVLDYAHKPDALKVALAACREVAEGRVLCVFGCGGDRDRGKRPLMGRIAALGADRVFVTSDNPRSEDPDAIITEIMAGVPPEADCVVEPDRREAIGAAISDAGPGDVVLVAGKGHEQYQIIGSERLPFDEREVVAEAIAAGGKGQAG
jgi:UDP-N-acetylmuramoyl-L-alanyl-D-glutamate--2,6-diaminopimelate ligase